MTADLLVRLATKYVVLPSGCWEWTASRTATGYGHVSTNGRLRGAHRLMYELLVGPIPDGLSLDHLCRNRACVNPDHLEPVTHAENVRRGRVAMANAERVHTHCRRGHEYAEVGFIANGKGGRTCRACKALRRKQYG